MWLKSPACDLYAFLHYTYIKKIILCLVVVSTDRRFLLFWWQCLWSLKSTWSLFQRCYPLFQKDSFLFVPLLPSQQSIALPFQVKIFCSYSVLFTLSIVQNFLHGNGKRAEGVQTEKACQLREATILRYVLIYFHKLVISLQLAGYYASISLFRG